MTLKFSNNGTSTLASSITSSQTSLTLQAGTGVRFPTLAASDYFMATIVDTAGNMEIVRVTARSADTLTATRGQEGTLARAFDAGSYIANHLTAGQLATFFNTDNDGAGSGLDADLLDGLQHQATNVPSSIVSRDSNGDFAGRVITAQTFTGALNGNATSATTATNIQMDVDDSTAEAQYIQFGAAGGSSVRSKVSNRLTFTPSTGVLQTAGIIRANSAGLGGGTEVLGKSIELAAGATGDVTTFIDFHARAGSDFDARIIREQGVGGAFDIDTTGAGSVLYLATGGARRFGVDQSANFYRVIPGGSTLYPDFACRAWVNFNGQGTVAILGQGNVSSITDNGVGDYTINFSTALPDGNYSIGNMSTGATDRTHTNISLRAATTNFVPSLKSSTQFRIDVSRSANTPTDTADNSICVFR